MVNFHKQRAKTTENMVRYGPFIELEEDIMVPNNVTKFHKILIKSVRLREQTSFKTVNFHKQRAITAESMVRYGPLSNLKKTSRYLTMCDGSVKTTESSSITSSSSLSAITENGLFSACFAFCAASFSYGACSLSYCCRLFSLCCFFSLSVFSFFFFSSSFFIISRVACLRAGPG